jgi:S1-C subfamily serine protease
MILAGIKKGTIMNHRQIIITTIIAFFVGAIGSIVISRFVLPAIGLNKFSTSAPIIINRTETVQLNEGANLIELNKQASGFVVSIFSKGPANFLGNGIVVTSDGLIFSSKQVVGSQTEVVAVTNDGKNFPALVRAVDPKSDLAILTIQATNLPIAQFDNAADLQVGQRIAAVGRSKKPFEHKFMTGFVTYSSDDFQTDLELDLDMVGGPLINLSGHVVAMATSPGGLILSEDLQKFLTDYLSKTK